MIIHNLIKRQAHLNGLSVFYFLFKQHVEAGIKLAAVEINRENFLADEIIDEFCRQ